MFGVNFAERNDKTKFHSVINNPNNPLGKVYSKHELNMVADLCQKFDTICVSDLRSSVIKVFVY